MYTCERKDNGRKKARDDKTLLARIEEKLIKEKLYIH